MTSVVVRVARHCLYIPDGSPVRTGEVAPIAVHPSVELVARNGQSEDLTSKVILVPAGSILSQNRASVLEPVIVVFNTCDAIVAEM